MTGINNHIPILIYTQRGLIPVDQAVHGDIVIEYRTNSKLQVLGIEKSDLVNLYKVEYTDGREEIYTEDSIIFNGDSDSYISITDGINGVDFNEIVQFPVDLNFSNVNEKLCPDPYAAGALIIYGRYDTPYLNLPRDRSAADELLANKYNLNFADKLEDNTVFYSWNGSDSVEPITWKEFFPNYDFYATSRNINSPLIPVEYSTASLLDRRKFIQGVFDIGYDKDIFPNNIGIVHVSEDRLLEVQKMLWSLGILSKISYDPNMPIARGRNFRLDILNFYSSYPGFFYAINNIIYAIKEYDRMWHNCKGELFTIKSISPISQGYMSNLILDKPHALYITENFIPRLSV